VTFLTFLDLPPSQLTARQLAVCLLLDEGKFQIPLALASFRLASRLLGPRPTPVTANLFSSPDASS
jgi:hypothetical protein